MASSTPRKHGQGGREKLSDVNITLRLPGEIVQRIDAYAVRESRTRTNMCAVMLRESIERRAAAASQPA